MAALFADTEVEHNGLYFRIIRTQATAKARQDFAILLLHGWLGTSRDWLAVAALLSSEGFDVLVPDLPFHGRSRGVVAETPADAGYSIAVAAASLVRLYGLAGFDPDGRCRIALVGYSLGGRVALEALRAKHVGDVVDVVRLCLISSALPLLGEATREERRVKQVRLRDKLWAMPTKAALRKWLVKEWYEMPMWGQLSGEPCFAAIIEQRLDDLLGPTVTEEEALSEAVVPALFSVAKSAVHFCPSSIPENLTAARASCSQIPVLYVHGTLDEKYSHLAAQVRARLAPHAEVLGVAGAGHNVCAQQLEHVTKMISVFMKKPFKHGPTLLLSKMAIRGYEVPLGRSMSVGGVNVARRRGFLVVFADDRGNMGVGDVAPLPGLHSESLETCRSTLETWWEEVHASAPGCFAVRMEDVMWKHPRGTENFPPSLAAAVCAALAQALGGVLGLGISSIFSAFVGHTRLPRADIRYNSVAPRPGSLNIPDDAPLFESGGSSLDASSGRHVSGAPVFKLKVGHLANVEADVALALSSGTFTASRCGLLRVDANQSWSVSEFRRFCLGTCSLGHLEYVEEPFRADSAKQMKEHCQNLYRTRVPDLSENERLHPLGFDESLVQFGVEDTVAMLDAVGVAAVVLKPSVQGHLSRCIRLAREAEERGLKVVLSSVFDSGIGLAWASVLASAFGSPVDVAHGVGTFASLVGDACEPSFREACVREDDHFIGIAECELLLSRVADDVMRNAD